MAKKKNNQSNAENQVAEKNKFLAKLNNFAEKTGLMLDESFLEEMTDKVKDINKLPAKERGQAVKDWVNDTYKETLSMANVTGAARKSAGKNSASVTETFAENDAMLRAAFSYFQNIGMVNKNASFPTHGGLSAEELTGELERAYNEQPDAFKNDEAKKEVDLFKEQITSQQAEKEVDGEDLNNLFGDNQDNNQNDQQSEAKEEKQPEKAEPTEVKLEDFEFEDNADNKSEQEEELTEDDFEFVGDEPEKKQEPEDNSFFDFVEEVNKKNQEAEQAKQEAEDNAFFDFVDEVNKKNQEQENKQLEEEGFQPVPTAESEPVKTEGEPVTEDGFQAVPIVEGDGKETPATDDYQSIPTEEGAQPTNDYQPLSTEEPKTEPTAEPPMSPAEKEVGDAFNDYEKTTGLTRDTAYFQQLQNAVDRCNKMPPQLREAAIANVFENEFRRNMKQATLVSQQREAKGKEGIVPQESILKTDRMLRSAYQFMQQNGSISKNVPYPVCGGIPAQELTDHLNKAFYSRPLNKQTPADKKTLDEFSKTLTDGMKFTATTQLDGLVAGINKVEGTSLSGEGIRNYLDYCWKDACKKYPDAKSRQEAFQKDYQQFAEKAFGKFTEQIGPKTDLSIQTGNFNRMMNYVNQYCKQNGMISPNQPYQPFGGLSASKMAELQTNKVQRLPANIREWAKQRALQEQANKNKQKTNEKDPLELSDKEKKQLEKEQKQPDKNTPTEQKEEIGNLEQNKGVGENKTPSKEDMAKMIADLPKLEDGQAPSKEAQQAMEYCAQLDRQHSERSRSWRFFHPVDNAAESKELQNAMKAMREKGYLKPDENGKESFVKVEDDLVKAEHEQQIGSINDVEAENNDLIMESEAPQFNEIGKSAEQKVEFKKEDGINTAEELNNPENPSPAVTMEQQAPQREVQQGISNG